MITRDLPRHCTWNTDRHGRRRVRFRKGYFSIYLSGVPYSESFMQQYHALLDGQSARIESKKDDRLEPGSINALIVSFYQCTDFVKLKASTQRARRNMLEKFRAQHGKKRVVLLTAAHVKAMMGDMADRPDAANNLLKALRVLLRHAIDMGLIQDDPSRNVRKFSSGS